VRADLVANREVLAQGLERIAAYASVGVDQDEQPRPVPPAGRPPRVRVEVRPRHPFADRPCGAVDQLVEQPAEKACPSTNSSGIARRVAALLDADQGGDVVFGPGSRFLVLDVRHGDADTPDLVFLRELPETAFPAGEEPPPGGHLALTRLDEALEAARSGPDDTVSWPAHCLGPIGAAPITAV